MKKCLISQFIAVIVSFAIVVQILPINVMASAIEDISINTNQMVTSATEEIPNIVAEVIEERDQFSKVYLLEDGSYYSISTYAPIHENVNGKWETIDEELDEFTESVETVESSLQQASVNLLQESNISLLSDSSPVDVQSSNLIKKILDLEEFVDRTPGNSEIVFNENIVLLLKPSSLNYHLNHNKVVLEANLSAYCSVESDHTSSSLIYLREMSVDWNEESTFEDFEDFSLGEDRLMDSIAVPSNGNYEWDITDLYGKWDREILENKGVYVHSTGACSLTLSSLCISVRYKDVDEKDLDSTYHTIDMGRAGTVYINDITNTVKLEQDILTINRGSLPISLKRIYNLTNAASLNSAGVGFRWNYESKIDFDSKLLSWKMFDGTVRHYVKSDIVDGDYQKWVETGKVAELSTDSSVMWVKTSELNNSTYDYSNFYAEINGVRYTFDSVGRVIKMKIGNNELNAINFNYSNGVLTSLTYSNADDTVTTISFTFPSSGSGHVHFSTFNSNNDENSYQQIVRFTTSIDESTNITTNTITYNDSKSVSYKFNTYGELIEVIGIDGKCLRLTYFGNSSSNKGNRLKKYEVFTGVSSSSALIESMEIDTTNTYQRVFVNKDNLNELIQYDVNYNIVSHKSYEGNYTFAEYDENNVMCSYTLGSDSFSNEDKVEIAKNNSFETVALGKLVNWTFSDSEIIKVVEPDTSSEVECIDGSKYVRFSYTQAMSEYMSQELKDASYLNEHIELDKTYIVGGCAYIDNSIPNTDRPLVLKVEVVYENASVYEEVASIQFDVTCCDQWQYRLTSFKLLQPISKLKITVDYSGQAGTMYIDNVTLYKSTDTPIDISDFVYDSPYLVTKNEDNQIISESFSYNDSSLTKYYTYDNNEISSTTDINGVTTYYEYNDDNGELTVTKTIKSGDDIIDISHLSYYVDGTRKSIQQTVENIENGNLVNLQTMYSENSYPDNGRIATITHNGFSYEFVYDIKGNLLSVDTVSENDTDTDNEEDTKTITYDYNTNDTIGEITYENGLKVNYIYNDSSNISSIRYIKDNAITKEITYSYDDKGNLLSIEDSATNYRIEYTDNGYNLYRSNGNNTILFYVLEKKDDGSVIEKYRSNLYSADGNAVYSITTSNTSFVNDVSNGTTTAFSSVSIDKINEWSNATNYTVYAFDYNRQSINDYFGRIVQKSIELQESTKVVESSAEASVITNGQNSRMIEQYEYQELSSGVTSTLVSSHTTTFDAFDSSDNCYKTKFSTEDFYEYDANGNAIFIYTKGSNNSIIPKSYYEYDDAGQLVGEVNCEKELSAKYVYDAGGNLTKKIIFEFSEVTVDSITNTITNYGNIKDTIIYEFDTIWKDRVVNYNGTSIEYDSYGNPLKYVGSKYVIGPLNTDGSDNTVVAELKWNGKYLASFETSDELYEYEYDANGYRTRRVVKDKDIDPETGEAIYSVNRETMYIWDNGVLKSVIFNATSQTSQQSDIIYDQEGVITGFVSHDGCPIYFVRDNNGSVKRLIETNGKTVADIYYDAWGHPTIKVNANTSTTQGTVDYIAYGLVMLINPSAYNGYLFDYESGLYYFKDRVYSPTWGRYLNPVEHEILLEETDRANSANLYVFCNNNPINILDPYSAWVRKDIGYVEISNGFNVTMSDIYLSRPFCIVFANMVIKENGTWDYNNGFSFYGMNTLEIAESLFAHSVGRYAFSAVNKVNAVWGDGWILNNLNADSFIVQKDDKNAWKYKKIWYAAPDIRMYAWSNGIYIIL